MYAIIADGGRQYKVEEGQELEVDYRDLPPGDQLTFGKVLAVSAGEGLKLGQPTVTGASVTAEVVGPALGEKIYIQKFSRRKNFRRRTGHRQIYTMVRINKIADGARSEEQGAPSSELGAGVSEQGAPSSELGAGGSEQG